jgi:hypothetical protein
VIRHRPDGELDYGVLYDAYHASGRTGFTATIFLTNIFLLPAQLDEFLQLPREMFDTAEELALAGWRVD